jgi:hypothetical protein
MSRRREALERAYEREEEQLQRDVDQGLLSQAEYNTAARDLQREASREAREAMVEDINDAYDEWRF